MKSTNDLLLTERTISPTHSVSELPTIREFISLNCDSATELEALRRNLVLKEEEMWKREKQSQN